jgi:hypothetical protein
MSSVVGGGMCDQAGIWNGHGIGTVNKKEGQTRRCSSGDGGGVGRDYEEQTVAEGWNGQTSGRYTERVLRLL